MNPNEAQNVPDISFFEISIHQRILKIIFTSTTVFIMNHKKHLLSTKISILEWFLKDHVTEDWSNDAENWALPSQE